MAKKKSSNRNGSTKTPESDDGYKVEPGNPPRDHQWGPGQSGNPKGAKRKEHTIAPDLKEALQRALNKKIVIKQGEKQRLVTLAVAGIEQLMAQFVKGDRHARRDVFALADKLGVDLLGESRNALDSILAANRKDILEAYVDRQYNKYRLPKPVQAPPELLDDDEDDQIKK